MSQKMQMWRKGVDFSMQKWGLTWPWQWLHLPISSVPDGPSSTLMMVICTQSSSKSWPPAKMKTYLIHRICCQLQWQWLQHIMKNMSVSYQVTKVKRRMMATNTTWVFFFFIVFDMSISYLFFLIGSICAQNSWKGLHTIPVCLQTWALLDIWVVPRTVSSNAYYISFQQIFLIWFGHRHFRQLPLWWLRPIFIFILGGPAPIIL